MKNKVVRHILLFFLPLLGAWFLKVWFATCRVRVHNTEWLDEAEASGRPIVRTCWHYCALGFFAVNWQRSMVVMISASKDGEYLARVIERLGFAVVRGSSNVGGARAARELIRELRLGKHAGLVADGSQGPARIMQSGPVLLAAKSGGIVLPVLYSVSRYFTFNTWDRLVLPKPFSVIDVFYGEPYVVPEEKKAGGLKVCRAELEERLNTLYDEVWALQGKKEH